MDTENMNLEQMGAYWQLKSKDEIIQYIIKEFHCNHRIQLAELLALCVELGNRLIPTGYWPEEFHPILLNLYEDLLEHMQREEQILFPLILSNEFGSLYNEKGLALHNHDHHHFMLDRLAQLSGDLGHIHQSELATDQTRVLLEQFQSLLSHFSTELRRHIQIENDFLFVE